MRNIDEAIIHCTATRPEWWKSKSTNAKVDEVRRWHVEDRGWSDIGYHYLIDRDGTVAEGRPIEKVGAHTKGHNTGTVGIALFGGFGSSENDQFEEHFTAQQRMALRDLLSNLHTKHGITSVTGHNEYAAKACPGFQVHDWLMAKPPRSIAKSTTLQATVATGVAGATGVGTAIGSLDGTAQIVVIVAAAIAALALIYIARERIRKWSRGVR